MVLCLVMSGTDVQANSGQNDLFGEFTGVAADPGAGKADPTIVRRRPVYIHSNLVSFPHGSQGDANPSGAINLNLFPDVSYTAVFDRIELNPSGSLSWVGHIPGQPMSQVILISQDGLMAGNISMPGAFYQVRYDGGGVHSIREIDQSKFPDNDDVAIPVDTGESQQDVGPMKDDGSIVDVMVVYTPSARSAVGGTSAMNTLIDLAISETNTSYQNSGVTHRVRLVHKAEVSYTESGFSAALSALTSKTDGNMDEVHTLRDQYGADEVVLLINNGSSCGLAWLMTTVSTSFKTSAFAVADHTCATGYYSFGHEIGHNMGARHDRYVDTSNTPYDTSHGYVNVSGKWRTIMAYNDKCSASGSSCTRIQYWSNPDVTYQGNIMGVATGNSTAADNRSTLNNTAYTVSNFRDSVASSSATLSALTINGSSSIAGGSSTTYTLTATYSNGSTATVTPSLWYVTPTTYASISSSGALTTSSVSSQQSITVAATYTEGGVTLSKTLSVTITSSTAIENGIWQRSDTMSGTTTQYLSLVEIGTSGWGIRYSCAVTNVLPCTWDATVKISIPDGTVSLNTAYTATTYMAFSQYTYSIVFTSNTTMTATVTGCSAVTEAGYTAEALASGGSGYYESTACSTPTSTVFNYSKLALDSTTDSYVKTANENGIWQRSDTMTGTTTQYMPIIEIGSSAWGIRYSCSVTNVLPCTWDATVKITLPSGTGALNTAYTATAYMAFSQYTYSVVFTSATTMTLTVTGCSAVTESGYTAEALASGGSGYYESTACSTPTSTVYNYSKLGL
jgi:hypothetical protein